MRGVILSDSFFPALRQIEPNFGKMVLWTEVREKFALVGVTLGETVDFEALFRGCAALDAERLSALEAIYGTFGRGWVRQLPRFAESDLYDLVHTNRRGAAKITRAMLRGLRATPLLAGAAP